MVDAFLIFILKQNYIIYNKKILPNSLATGFNNYLSAIKKLIYDNILFINKNSFQYYFLTNNNIKINYCINLLLVILTSNYLDIYLFELLIVYLFKYVCRIPKKKKKTLSFSQNSSMI